MRPLHTVTALLEQGHSWAELRRGLANGRWQRAVKGVYAEGPEDVTRFDCARALVLRSRGIASGTLAGVLLGFDAVTFGSADFTADPRKGNWRQGARRRVLPPERIIEVGGVKCTDGLQTLVDLGDALNDDDWEAALESALHRRLATIGAIEAAAHGKQRGAARMRRVLALRPSGAPPTESFLETRMVQLCRTIPGLPPPERQVIITDEYDNVVARLDLSWSEFGLFLEMDGQHHKGQPVYDANRETAVVAATGWLCGRFTYREVIYNAKPTARRLGKLVDQARKRPIR